MTTVRTAESQGADITPLLQPLDAGELALKNRFVTPGTQHAWCEGGAPSDKLVDYYRRGAPSGRSAARTSGGSHDE